MKRIFLLAHLFLTISVFGQTYISIPEAINGSGRIVKQPFYIFPETREHPLKWNDSLQQQWLQQDYTRQHFALQARPEEYFVYQVGVWATQQTLPGLNIRFSDLRSNSGRTIPAARFTCFNAGGTDYLGKSFSKKITVEKGRVQALWMGADLSRIPEGTYQGSVTVSANRKSQTIKLQLEVRGEPVVNHGLDEGKRLSRMFWLNSTLGIDNEPTKGYTPVSRTGHTLNILGRSLTLAPNGLPSTITSYFSASNQAISTEAQPVLKDGFRFVVEKENGELLTLQPGELKFIHSTPGSVSWEVKNSSPDCDLTCSGRLEFDGFVDYKLALTARKPIQIKDIRLEVPVEKKKATYMMGLNHEGGIRPPSWEWGWDTTKNQDALWLGAVNGGLRIKLKAENYVLPLVNIYYAFGPLHLPPSWGNAGKGGVTVSETNETVLLNAYSGSRNMIAGSVLHYDFELLITPFRTINREVQYGDRYFHGGGTDAFSKIEKAEKAGANIINIHHAEDLYPFINYPYLDENVGELKELVDKAHADHLRVKLYYTTRELTKNIPEFYPFYSLDGEVLYPGPGNASRTEALHPKGPNEWLIKNLREKYIPAWYNPVKEGKFKGELDLSVITTPNSRLNNFYIGGLDWMLQHLQIDGVYIDDSALDRFTLRRARKLIDRYRPEGRMDMHSWNHFNKWAGYANCLNLYMDLLPYFDLVWIGEGRDYNRLPDHWLVEVSGIPFGLPGQMLEGGGNPWRGMVYGITSRAGWTRNPPGEIWKFWDDLHFIDKKFTGYWDPECPVTVDNENIRASVFRGEKQTVIAIANWSKEEEGTPLQIDWEKLGYNATTCSIEIPYIKDFQEAQPLQSLSTIDVPGGKGYLIVITENN